MKRTDSDIPTTLSVLTDALVERLQGLSFGSPVTHTYNPLIYARDGYEHYLSRFANATKRIVLVGMNPGPFGMAQTGVPFGDVSMVTGWMGIRGTIVQPETPHPKRPINGFACPRGEVSGRRLWGWARDRFGSPEGFFEHFFVLNYCPLVFMEASGRNRTPDRLPVSERTPLFSICDAALREAIGVLNPRHVVGIGGFAEKRAKAAMDGLDIMIGRISHPSPANPKANRGWAALVEEEFSAMGIELRQRT